MAQQDINIGISPNDGSGDPLRDAFDKCNDNFDELYAAIASIVTESELFRSKNDESCDGTNGQTISYSSEFTADCVVMINDYNGVGIQFVSQSSTGFVINSLSAGTFGYIALSEN